jgi:hypothetical protein
LKDINEGINKAWGLLTPEQQAAFRDEFLKGIDTANEAGQTRLAELGTTIAEATKTDLQKVQDALTAAAEKMTTAADTQLEAAQTPVVVEVHLDTAEVNG